MLMSQKDHDSRPFELLKRRIGGFEDDQLRRILVRAGGVRFYKPYRDVYFGEDLSWVTPEQKQWIEKHEPVELWGLAKRPPNIAYLLGDTIVEAEALHGTPGFPTQVRK
jgi:hypothetical protein